MNDEISRSGDRRRRLHGRQRRVSPGGARRDRCRADRARAAARCGSTGRNAGGFRHQFSHPANIELSKESIALFARFEEAVGFPIDFWPDGYLFLLSSPQSVAAFRAQRRAAASARRRRGLADPGRRGEARSGHSMSTASLAATFCASDGIADPNGVTMGFARAAQARGVEIRRGEEVTGIDVANGRVASVQDVRGIDLHAARRQRRRTVGGRDRAHGRTGRARRARAPSHLHRATAGRRQLGRARASRRGARQSR